MRRRTVLAALSATLLALGAGCAKTEEPTPSRSSINSTGSTGVGSTAGGASATSTRPTAGSTASTAPGSSTTAKPANPTTSSTTAAPTTSASAPTTKAPTSTTVAPTPTPGSACALGSSPDCIDPDGDGAGTYLVGGAACMATFPDSPGLCSDLDGDGKAGYPDSGG